MKNPKTTVRLWQAQGLPLAHPEYRFHPTRKWRFDYAFPNQNTIMRYDKNAGAVVVAATNFGGIAVEVQGGIWTRGRHTRGAALKKEWEKLNTAAALGWRILYCAPGAEHTTKFVQQLAAALQLKS